MFTRASVCPDKFNTCPYQNIPYHSFSKVLDKRLEDKCNFYLATMKKLIRHILGHFARDCRAKRTQDSRRRDVGYNVNQTRDNGRRHVYEDDSNALVTIDGEDIDWSGHLEEDTHNYAMMAYSSSNSGSDNKDDLHRALKDKGIVDSGCSKHMTGNKAHLADYQEFNGGSVAFGGTNGRITGSSGRAYLEGLGYESSPSLNALEGPAILSGVLAVLISVKTASTPIETQEPLVRDEEVADVDVHLYWSMIGSLMYLTAFRPDIMFAVCACSRFQVTPKTSHLQAVKRIFRYLKGKPKLGLWYLKVSSFDLEAYSDSDYASANLDRKSTIEGCQLFGRRLISWQCKKQTIVATSTTKAEYIAAAHCCGQVLQIQNQLLDYGFNFMNTKIYIDNESTICIVKNLVFHSKTKHIEIRHHFIRDAYEKKLIQVLKIHTNDNIADQLTKALMLARLISWLLTLDCLTYSYIG
nr:putative ribonuclease H-like domain-containing protein [Tanacetum cinerariifolium]